MSTEYPLAFAAGLLGGFGHCLGMCGPIVAALALPGGSGARAISHLLYHCGRIITYTCIGAAMGLTGSFVNTAGRMAGLQNAVAVAAGLLMIVMGLSVAQVIAVPSRLEGGTAWFLRAARPIGESTSAARYFPLGLLLGFLPCGLSYTMFLGAAATGSMMRGFGLALFFGLGTAGPLVVFGLAMGRLGARTRGLLYRAAGVVVIVMGILFVTRGISFLAAL